MAIREYECVECGHITEVGQPIAEEIPPVVVCEKCDCVAKKIISAKSAFILRGEGWPGKDLKRGIDE